MANAYGWAVFATMAGFVATLVGLLATALFRLDSKIDSKIDGLGRDFRTEIRELRTEMHEGFSQIDNRLRVLEGDRRSQ